MKKINIGLVWFLAAVGLLAQAVWPTWRPGITWVSHANGGSVLAGAATLELKLAALDTVTVYDGGATVGTLPYYPPYTLAHTFSGAGPHVLRAVGCFNNGRLMTNEITVYVVDELPRVKPKREAAGAVRGGF